MKLKCHLNNYANCATRFVGLIEQMPPPFSAKKIKGVPAYKLARRHQEVALKPVQVEIKQFEILAVEGDRASFRARVASGTYMRSVAHDMGQQLGCGAHLQSLRRTSLGEFDLSQAHTLEELEAAVRAGKSEELFIHPRLLLPEFPCVTATEETAALIRNGRAVNLPELSQARQVKVFAGQRELIAIATRIAGTLFHPRIVLARHASRRGPETVPLGPSVARVWTRPERKLGRSGLQASKHQPGFARPGGWGTRPYGAVALFNDRRAARLLDWLRLHQFNPGEVGIVEVVLPLAVAAICGFSLPLYPRCSASLYPA